MNHDSKIVSLVTGVCKAGEEYINDTCSECQIGFYKNNSDDLKKYGLCIMCQVDFITETSGSTSSDDCKIGYYRLCLIK